MSNALPVEPEQSLDERSGAVPRAPLRRLDGTPIASPWTVRAGVAVAEALFARNGAPPPPARLDYLAWELEDFLARCGVRSRMMLSLMIGIVTFLAPLLVGRLGRLQALPLAERVRALTTLEDRFAEPLLAVKAMLCLLYYEHPDPAREAGFDGECLVPTHRKHLTTVR